MKATLYRITTPREYLNKIEDFNESLEINVLEPYDNIDILNPELIIDYKPGIIEYNYCYIPDFKRYYFVNNITLQPGKRAILSCHVDVLMTYQIQILNSYATVIRNEDIGPNYISDNRFPSKQERFCDAKYFPLQPFTFSFESPIGEVNQIPNIVVSVISNGRT